MDDVRVDEFLICERCDSVATGYGQAKRFCHCPICGGWLDIIDLKTESSFSFRSRRYLYADCTFERLSGPPC